MVLQPIARRGASGPHDKSPGDGNESDKHKANALIAGLLLSLILLTLTGGPRYGGVLLLKSHAHYHLGPAAFIAAAFFLILVGLCLLRCPGEGCLEEDEDQ